MMEFVLMTVSFTVAILLASALSLIVMCNTKVSKWAVKLYLKQMNKFDDEFFEGL